MTEGMERKTMKIVNVAAAIVIEDGRVFATQRGYGPWKDWWEFPGGKVEAGETHARALRREIKEELDAEISVGSLFCRLTHEYPDLTVDLYVYEAVLESEGIRLMEHNAAEWITPGEIDNYSFCPADETVLDKIKQRSA